MKKAIEKNQRDDLREARNLTQSLALIGQQPGNAAGWNDQGRIMTMANSNDGKFQKSDENSKNAAKKGGESSRGGNQGSGNKSSGKSEGRSSGNR
jgi:hypothetical protein